MFFKKYRGGRDFEEAVLEGKSTGIVLSREFRRNKDFREDILSVIKKSKYPYPKTPIGQSLYFLLRRKLEKAHINTRGLALISCLDSRVDILHGTDCLFYLPSIGYLVTIDLYNLNPEDYIRLKDMWLDSSSEVTYGEEQRQTDLYYCKIGWSNWRKESNLYDPGHIIPLDARITDFDFRVFCGPPQGRNFPREQPREINHFVLTPYHTGSYQNRRGFASMVAEHFIQMSRHQKVARKRS